MRNKQLKVVLVIFTLAALLYNSWPLGYLLNYKTARFGLASDLDLSGHPYNWVFIVGDMLVGASLLAVVVLMRLKLHKEFWSKKWLTILIGLLVFGVFTAVSAEASPGCTAFHVNLCPTFHKRLLGPDGVESGVAILGLLASLIGVNVLSSRLKLSKPLRFLARLMLVAWPASVIMFLVAADKNNQVHITQEILLVLSGLALLVIGLNINGAIERQAENQGLSSH